MAAFQKEVFDSTKEAIDPKKAQRIQDELQRQARTVQRQFGGQQQAGTPRLGIGSPSGSEAATSQYALDEFNRRKAATGSAFDLGTKVDTRRSQLADELNAAVRRRKLATDKYATSQDQEQRKHDLEVMGIGQDVSNKMKELGFSAYKSQTDRNMAMADLYGKGMLEAEMFQAGVDNSLKLQDIDNYFSMLEANLRADFEAEMKNAEWNWTELERKLNRDANNVARLIEGIVTGGQAGAYKMLENK